jgi:cation transport ATPase
MVGDGINDAAALAAATCGIAVSGSAEAALSAADVFVDAARARQASAVPALAAVALLVDGAAATMAVIRRNLRFSIVYNLVGVTLAVTGLIHPLIGAIMMPLSSLTVVSSSAWSRAFREPS